MLAITQRREVAQRFGVSDSQVERDHLISHLLGAIDRLTRSAPPTVRPVFFGGTALARTWLPDGRLSEDIDLYVRDRPGLLALLESPRGLLWELRREFPGSAWAPKLSAVPNLEPAGLIAGPHRVRVQALNADGGYQEWPTEERDLIVRYGDAPPARLPVPTRDAFVAMKVGAWNDRHAPRDLWDLSQLAKVGAFTPTAAELVQQRHGVPIAGWMFRTAPTHQMWAAALTHQTAAVGDAIAALAAVREGWNLDADTNPDD